MCIGLWEGYFRSFAMWSQQCGEKRKKGAHDKKVPAGRFERTQQLFLGDVARRVRKRAQQHEAVSSERQLLIRFWRAHICEHQQRQRAEAQCRAKAVQRPVARAKECPRPVYKVLTGLREQLCALN